MHVEKCAKGECVCAYSTCDGKCVNTMGSDNANCGKCGKACDYQCTMGSCGPATIPTPDLNEIGPIVTDDTNVYWLGTTSTGFEVEYCPLAGCTGGKPTTLADTNAASSFSFFGELSLGQLTVSASTLYFADDDLDVLQCALPPTGCALTPTTYSTNADFEETYVAATSTKVYWANNEAETVYDCAAGASCVTPTLLQNDTTLGLTPEGMFVTDSAIYWGAGDEETTINIYSAALTGGAVSTVCTQTSGSFEGGNLTQLIVAGGFVYFSDGESTIYSCSATATGATAAVYIMDSNGPGGLAASATDLYWADSGFGGFSSSSTTPTGAIRKCALGASCPLYADGGTSAITVVDKIPSPDGLAVGTTQVYWTSDNMDMPQVNYFSK